MHPPSPSGGGGPLPGESDGGAGPGGDGAPSSWKACVYYARGFCKHGASCRFSHEQPPSARQASARVPLSPASSGEAGEPGPAAGDGPSSLGAPGAPGSASARGSPVGGSAWLALVAAELQELLLAHGAPVSLASLPHLYCHKYGKALEPDGPPRDAHQGAGTGSSRGSPAAVLRLVLRLKGALTVFERPDGQKAVALKRGSPQKGGEGDTAQGGGDAGLVDSPSSRQIYLTFPAESSFSEADVAQHFGLFGTVHDVRIPHQQKRMFGFVTFAGPEPVRAILKHGNPHFICGSRVLVKPYRERAKPADRYKHAEGAKSSEPYKHGRGSLESKIPPRHLNARAEGKAGPGLGSLNARGGEGKPGPGLSNGPRAGGPQGWAPLHPPQARSGPQGVDPREAESSQTLHLPGVPAPGPVPGGPGAGHGSHLHEEQDAPDACQPPADSRSAVAPAPSKAAPAPLSTATPYVEHWAESQELETSPWPRARLFHSSDSPQGACDGQHQDSLTAGRTQNVEDDLNISRSTGCLQDEARGPSCLQDEAQGPSWRVLRSSAEACRDLDSLLPESPFSSPKKGKNAPSQGSPFAAARPEKSVLRSSAGEWQPSSLPAAPAPPAPLYWGYAGDSTAYLPVSNGHWAGEPWQGKDAGQEQGLYAMMPQGAGMQELSHSMAYLAVTPGHPHTPTLEAIPVDTSSLAKRATLLCTTCRAQPVGIPNSQCTYCLQLACHSYTHEAHLYQEMTPTWHVPVNTYIRASHNSSC